MKRLSDGRAGEPPPPPRETTEKVGMGGWTGGRRRARENEARRRNAIVNCWHKWARVKDNLAAFSRVGRARARVAPGVRRPSARDSHFSITEDNKEWNSARTARTTVFMNAVGKEREEGGEG